MLRASVEHHYSHLPLVTCRRKWSRPVDESMTGHLQRSVLLTQQGLKPVCRNRRRLNRCRCQASLARRRINSAADTKQAQAR